MNNLNVSNDIIPIGDFKINISKYFRNVQNSGHPLIITQNGRPAGVLISPAEYDELVHKRSFLESVNRGLSDIESGAVYSAGELKEELKNRRAKRNSG